MANNESKRHVFRSVWAVFAGILANFLIAVPIDGVLHAVGVFPPFGESMSDSLFALALSYRLIAALVGGYLTAYFAPAQPIKHVVILGVVGILMSSAGAIAMWDLGHQWYPITLVIISLPCSWAGGKFRLNQMTV